MNLRRVSRAAAVLAALLALSSVTAPNCSAHEHPYANTGNQAYDVVSVALTQLGYVEGEQGGSKYGKWYGLPHADWCAIFVSWCLEQAEVPSRTLRHFASCTTAMRTFQRAGIWQDGPYHGGSYTPKMGDLIFYDWYGNGTSSHVGIVLCTENGWVYSVEGNTSPNRLDVPEQFREPQAGERRCVWRKPPSALMHAFVMHFFNLVFIVSGMVSPSK